MKAKELQFPDGFLWGAATSAHQVEGGTDNDWSSWEKQNARRLAREAESKFRSVVPRWGEIKNKAEDPENYISGRAADHYRRFREDIKLLKRLNVNTYRFSVEWSRIMPEPDKFDRREIEHYRTVIRELKQNQIQPFITLWHRTNPAWVYEKGLQGWESPEVVGLYLKFVERVVTEFKTEVNDWMTFNEPMMFIGASYLRGEHPPEIKSLRRAWKVFRNIINGHKQAYRLIHRLRPEARVGITHAVILNEAHHEDKFSDRAAVSLVDLMANQSFFKAVQDETDFFGIQYYSRTLIRFRPGGKIAWFAEPVKTDSEKSDMGWDIYPRGIYDYLKQSVVAGKPLIITENGLADAQDRHRAEFIKDHLKWIHRAIREGVNIQGYFHWSLLDNFEWDRGLWPRFGLVEVNYKNQQRKIRPSAKVYAEICKTNKLIVNT